MNGIFPRPASATEVVAFGRKPGSAESAAWNWPAACWILLAAILIGGQLGCERERSGQSQPAPANPVFADAYPIRAVVTVGMVADLVRAVGGKEVAVTQLLGSGIDPHSYKATRDDIATVMQADMVFYNGLMLEGKMADSLKHAGENRPSIAVAEEIPAEFRMLADDGSSGSDPHLWMDVGLWSHAAPVIATALSRFDPTHAEDYHQRSQAFQAELVSLQEYCRTCIASIPAESRVLVTSHDAFRYFGRAYSIEVRGVQGISTESEAGLLRINQLVDLLVSKKIPAVFCESSVSQKTLEAVVSGAAARGQAVTILGPLFSDAMGLEGTWEGTWMGMLDHNVTLITRGLGGTAPEKGWRGRLGQPAGSASPAGGPPVSAEGGRP